MRIIGIDPGSQISGIAVIDTPDTVIHVSNWKRDKSKSHPAGFVSFHNYLAKSIYDFKPQMAVIEFGSYTGPKSNALALQAISFYQAIAALSCKLNGLIVVETRATSARKASLGRGNLSKDEVWEIMRKRYPDLFSAKTTGGLDESDALVLALAGPTVAER